MARNKSGGFNKLLNFIGLVDDEDTRDTYGEEYSEGYGRQSGYSPSRQSRAASGRSAAYSRQAGSGRPSGRMPDSGSRSRYESRYDASSGRYTSRYEDRGSSVPSRATCSGAVSHASSPTAASRRVGSSQARRVR